MKKINYALSLLLVSSFLFSCDTMKSTTPDYNYAGGYNSYDNNFSDSEKLEEKGYKYFTSTPPKTKRKVLTSAYYTLIVDVPDSANAFIEKIAEKYKGYVNRLGTDQTIIRVKSEDLEAALNEISSLGKVQSKNISGQDVTEQFLDHQIRLDNALKARDRYLELLKKAENVDAALKVERELERLNETIDLIKGKMNRINHLSQYSTITINLKERKKPGVLGFIGKLAYHSVKWLFVRN